MSTDDEQVLTELTVAAPPAKVEITVAGHTVAVEGPESTAELAALALYLYRTTALAARDIPLGFTAGAADLRDVRTEAAADHDDDELIH